MRKILLLIAVILIGYTARSQGIIERYVKGIENVETGGDFIYRTFNVPVLDITYHEFSADSITWRKNYVAGDCYVRFSNVIDNSASKHPSWWVYNICTQTSVGLDTIIVNYGAGQTETLTAGDYTINMTIPDTVSGTSTNSQTTTSHTHELRISLNDNIDVNAANTDGYVLKYNGVSQQWEAKPDLLASGAGGSLRVREEDGTPNVAAVNEIRVPNAHLINNGAGSVSLVLSVEPVSGENTWWRTGVGTCTNTGTYTVTFSSPLPDNNYIVANAYAIFSDSTRQNLNYSNLTANGFNVLGVVQQPAEVHYLAIYDVDSLLAVQAEIGKVLAAPTDPVYGYLSNKVDDSTIVVSNYQLHSIADLNDVTSNGATTSNTITVGGAHVDYTHYNTGTLSPSVTYEEGNVLWNGTDKTLDLQVGAEDVTIQLGQEMVVRVYNNTTSTITNGTVVYKTGRQGNVPTVGKAVASSANASRILGIATEDIPNGEYGFITTYGQVRGLNMVGYTINAPLYLGLVAGTFTETAPAYPNYRIKVGTVGVNTGNGTLDVEIGIDPPDGVVFNSFGVIGTATATNIVGTSTATFGSTTSNTTFEPDGTMVMNGNASVWIDLLPMAVDVSGGASAPSFTTYNGNLRAYEFVGAATLKDFHVGFQMPHGYKEGSTIYPHLHLYIPDDVTGGTISFTAEYTWTNTGATGTVAPQTITGTIVRTAGQGIANNAMLSLTPIVGTGKTISSILMLRVYRDPTAPQDTFGSSCWLKGIDVHVPLDQIGSREIDTK